MTVANMDAKAKAYKARAVLQDEIVQEAFKETLNALNQHLLNAKTPEEREQRWHEYHGLKRAWALLQRWPHEAG